MKDQRQYKDRQAGQRDKKKRMSNCHISAGREWECAAAGRPQSRQLHKSLIVDTVLIASPATSLYKCFNKRHVGVSRISMSSALGKQARHHPGSLTTYD